jgi:outer membrane receptor protein involved in Fe transport
MAPQSAGTDQASTDLASAHLIRVGALCAIALGLGITTSAYSQEAEKPASSEQRAPVSLDEVTVTGTRIKQRDDYVSPNPIQTIDSGEMKRLGIVNVSDAITQVPANVSQFTPLNTGGSAFFVGSTLANLRGLNPFFGTRTLTLVDTHRFIPTTQGDSVDLNFIPSNLIERTEVVTGGASAAYGSGAISGVVNILLDHRLEGLKLDVDYGTSERGDGDNYHAGLAGGSELFGGRGHIIAGGEYQKQDVIQDCASARDWCGRGLGAFSNDTAGFAFGVGIPYNAKIAGQPWNIVTDNLRSNQLSTSGVIFNGHTGATTTSQLNAAGTDIAPFAIGTEGWRSAGGNTIGGDGPQTYRNLSLFPSVERKTAYSRMSVNFTDETQGFVEASWGQVEGVNHQWSPGQNLAQNCIRPDNAFLAGTSAAFQAALAANYNNAAFATFPNQICGDPTATPNAPGILPFLNATILTKDWSLQNDQTVTTDTEVTRAVVGMSGSLSSTWTWEAYYQYGKTTRDQIGNGYRTNLRYDLAADAVIDNRVGSATLGKPVCRVTRDGVAPGASYDPSLAVGCQPLNPFGTSNASPEALAYAFGSLTEHDDIRQDVVAGTVTGEVWQGWGAGALSAAAGLEYRVDKLANLAGDLPFAQRTDFSLQYGDSFAGKTTVKEGFAELEMPLLKDLPGARAASLNGAVRKAKYKNEGGFGTTGETGEQDITTWKVAAVWDPLEWFRLRGSHSRDIRAAGFRELYYSQSVPAGGLFGSVQNSKLVIGGPVTSASDASVLILSGDPHLAPEKATTNTVGFVLSPGGWAESMHFSADYYKIDLTGGLALESAQAVVNSCFAGVTAKCTQLAFGTPLPGQLDPQSNITSVRAVYINQNPYEASGVDIAWDYATPLDRFMSSAKGSIAFRMQGTYSLETIIQTTSFTGLTTTHDVSGQTGGDQGFLSDFASAPNFAANLTTSYLNGPFELTGQLRWVSAGRLDKQNPKLGPGDEGYNPAVTYSTSDATVPSYYLLNLNGSYDFKWFGLQSLQVFANISNVFDKDPPFSAGQVGGANAVYFDTLGRTYRLGMRMAF